MGDVKRRHQTFSTPFLTLLQRIMMDAQNVHIAIRKKNKQECKITVSRHLTLTIWILKVYSILVILSSHSECRKRMGFLRIIHPTHPPYPPWSRMNCPPEMPASLLVTIERSPVADVEWTPSCSLLQLDGLSASQYGSSLKVESGNTNKGVCTASKRSYKSK